MAQSPRDVLAMINRHILASERNIAASAIASG